MSIWLLTLLLIVPVAFKLKDQIKLYRRVQHNLSSISRLRTSINTAVGKLDNLPAYYIEDLLLDNCQLIQDTNNLSAYIEKSNVFTFNNLSESKGENLNARLSKLKLQYSSLERRILLMVIEYKRLTEWTPPNSVVPSGSSKLAWMYGECPWSYFKACPTILSEIEYTTLQLSKYAEGDDIDKAIILLYRLEELEKLRDENIKKTDAARLELEELSESYLSKVNLLAGLRYQLDNLDLSDLIDSDPNIAGFINELYSLMNIGVQERWTKDYYQGKYDWFDEMVKGEVLLDKAVSMYQDLERRCGEK